MNASEATELTAKGKRHMEERYFDSALAEIKKAASYGWRQTDSHCSEEHSEAVMARLRALGYRVEFSPYTRCSAAHIIVRW